MSQDREIIDTTLGIATPFKGHMVKVQKLASKQKYIISKKDAFGNEVYFPLSTENVVQDSGFCAGELCIFDWKNERLAVVQIVNGDSLETIVAKFNVLQEVRAHLFEDLNGYRIIVESVESGVKNTFSLGGDALRFLMAVVPESIVQFVDIYDASGRSFESKDAQVDCFQVGHLRINGGFVSIEPFELSSLERFRDAVSAEIINADTRIIPCHKENNSCILRISNKIVGGHLTFTGGKAMCQNVQGSSSPVKSDFIKFSSAQDAIITIDGVSTQSSTNMMCNNILGLIELAATFDNGVRLSEVFLAHEMSGYDLLALGELASSCD